MVTEVVEVHWSCVDSRFPRYPRFPRSAKFPRGTGLVRWEIWGNAVAVPVDVKPFVILFNLYFPIMKITSA